MIKQRSLLLSGDDMENSRSILFIQTELPNFVAESFIQNKTPPGICFPGRGLTRRFSMILGITGAFGCGKSAVLAAFAAHGWRTADADTLCHELYAEPGGAMARQLAERWGKRILTAEGAVDRRKVGEIVFEKPEELVFLTELLYPELERKLDTLIGDCRRDGADGAYELPLLYEAGYEGKFDCVAAVWAAPEIRRARLREHRNFTELEIRQREARQLFADAKLERADFALINNGELRELELQVEHLVATLKDGNFRRKK